VTLSPPLPSERKIVLLVGAVQFVNILDFMMVMPLGPDFAKALGIPGSEIGLVGGSYTAAAAISGLVGALFLDRFDRRPALALAMLGLGLGTLAGAFARDLLTLVLARMLAGAFGGPASSVALSIISDVIPPERRGRAMGAVMTSFAVSSVLGVPAGLQLAVAAGWRAPFVAVAILGLLITVGVHALLPSLTVHLEQRGDRPQPGFAKLVSQPDMLIAYSMTLFFMSGTSPRTSSTT
jgi:predicted MFS family arabinose efflux permease